MVSHHDSVYWYPLTRFPCLNSTRKSTVIQRVIFRDTIWIASSCWAGGAAPLKGTVCVQIMIFSKLNSGISWKTATCALTFILYRITKCMLHSILTSHQYPGIAMFMMCFDVLDYTGRDNDKRFMTLQDSSKGHFLFALRLVTQCHADSLDAFTCA